MLSAPDLPERVGPEDTRGELSSPTTSSALFAYGTPPARWVLFAVVLGSGMAFLDGTIVNVVEHRE